MAPHTQDRKEDALFFDDHETVEENNTVIILDWDDTILPSSFLAQRGYRLDNNIPLSEDVQAQLKELEQSIINVVNLAHSAGRVHIITNAETGWVQMSCQKFLPRIVPLLLKVSVLSARSTFELLYPDAPVKWKYYAFQERVSAVSSSASKCRNVISFGDSHVEREAVRAVTKGMTHTRTKSVKFAERPTCEQLRRQLDLVANCFSYIAGHEGDLDLQLTVSTTPPATTGSSTTSSSTSSLAATPSTSTDASASSTASSTENNNSASNPNVMYDGRPKMDSGTMASSLMHNRRLYASSCSAEAAATESVLQNRRRSIGSSSSAAAACVAASSSMEVDEELLNAAA